MRHDIDWETACNDFHPAFALVRGERYVPDAKPFPSRRRAPSPKARVRKTSRALPVSFLSQELP
ncbi:MAG TPA: hypothetical protein VG942_06200 [Hyphomonadaceae bacterium]|nr:hypothetical protein [Hyphomonadaceae bacterium]